MQNQKILGPALRKRLIEVPLPERVSLRVLVSEFGKHVPPEVAYRAWKRTSANVDGPISMLELTQEQTVQLGRVRIIAEALQRIGAKFEGPRSLTVNREYWLPQDKRDEVFRKVGPTFLTLPTIKQALDHLAGRQAQVTEGKARSWNQDDQRAVMALSRLARSAEEAGLTESLLEGDPLGVGTT